MKLVNLKTNTTLVEFRESDTEIHDSVFNKEMIEHGIIIPHFLKNQYNNQTTVKKTDILFQKAFKEIYYRFELSSDQYRWID